MVSNPGCVSARGVPSRFERRKRGFGITHPYRFMVNRNLIRGLDLTEEDWQHELGEALEGTPLEEIEEWGARDVEVNKIVEGKVLRVENDVVLVDVGYKSEGIVFRNEWDEDEPLPNPGDRIKVLVEEVEESQGQIEDCRGMITLSKPQGRADRGLAAGDGARSRG